MKLGRQMPELIGETVWLNGQYDNADLIGNRPTLIHFWSISCKLCKEVMPRINYLRDNYKGDLNVIAVHMPRSTEDKDMQHIKKVAAVHDIAHPIFIDDDLILSDSFDVRYVPVCFLFDREGRLRHIQEGAYGMKLLEKRVKRVVDELKI